MAYYSVLTSLFMEQFWGYIMSRTTLLKDRPIFFLLDEASSLHLNLDTTISNLRKFRSGILAVYQSSFQLVSKFSEAYAKSLEENVFARVYLPGVDIGVATKLEQTLGKFEYQDEKNVRHTRSLMTASEIRMCDKEILLCSNLGPILLPLRPYYKQYRLKTLSQIPPYEQQANMPFEKVPFIQFD